MFYDVRYTIFYNLFDGVFCKIYYYTIFCGISYSILQCILQHMPSP